MLPISPEGGSEPAWSRNEGELFFRNGDEMIVVTVTTEPTLTAGAPRLVFRGSYYVTPGHAHWDVSPDGQGFLMLTREEAGPPPSHINIVLGWPDP